MAERRIINGYIVERQPDGSLKTIGPAGDQPQAGGRMLTLPPDEVQQATIDNARRDDARADALLPLREDLLRAQIRSAEAAAAKAERGTAGATAGDTKTQARLANLNSIVEQVNRVQELYNSGISQETKANLFGLLDGIGPEAGRFDSAGQGLADQGLAAFRVPGQGSQSDLEARQFATANTPQASDWDAAIEEKLANIRRRVDANRQQAGLPPAQWAGLPNALTAPRLGGAPANEAAGALATTTGEPVNPEYQREYTAWVTQNAGQFTPEQYAAFRSGLDQKYGYGATADYIAEGQRISDRFRQGGAQNLNIPPTERPLSDEGLFGTGAFSEQARNNAISNPVGAALAGFADMGGFGGVSALAPEQMAALNQLQPEGMALGQIGGAVTGTGAIGALGRNTIGRALPSLLGGAGKAQFGRNLATDAAYGGIYGGVTEGDPLSSAALGTLGSAGGQAVGKAAGATIGGLAQTPAAQTLRDYGVRLTTGQRLGGFAKGLEDAMTSAPGLGDIVNARRLEGFEDFNRAAFNEAGAPIGATVKNIGEQGVEELLGQAGDAYDSATAGVRVPFDTQFMRDLIRAERAGTGLPDDLSARFTQAIDNRIMPLSNSPDLTGEQYQQAFRGLKGYRAETTKPGFEQDYRDALTLAMDALTNQMERGGGQRVVSGLRNADQAYRGGKTLQRAVQAAKNGSGTGEIQVFTPAQLNTASTQAANKFGGGRQMADLIDAGQRTLPSQLPDSGTARRVATMALPGLLGGATAGGAGLGYATGDTGQGAATGLGVAALLALGGTRGGQKALNTILLDRGPRAQMIGRAISKRSGLFGSASLPLLIDAGG